MQPATQTQRRLRISQLLGRRRTRRHGTDQPWLRGDAHPDLFGDDKQSQVRAAACTTQRATPAVVSQYCNGARVPPEFGDTGWLVPPGISDATVPNPIFSLTPAATVDEGNNWINIQWGPLAVANPVTGTVLGNYAPSSGSSVINYIPSSATANYNEAPNNDFFGNPRKNGAVDAGAVEFQGAGTVAALSVTGGPLTFTAVVGTTSAAQTLTLNNTGGAAATGIALAFAPTPARFSRPAGAAGGTCGATLAAATTCTINVVFSPTAVGTVAGTLTITASVAVTGSAANGNRAAAGIADYRAVVARAASRLAARG